jgi:DinB superfamily
MTAIGTSLCAAFDHVWDRFTGRLEGLTDDEYLWEPVPGCWSIRPDSKGAWRIEGFGADTPTPESPPLTTIAWRIGHIAGMALGGFADRSFGDGMLTVQDLTFPSRVADLPAYCEANFRPWRQGIGDLDAQRWWSPLGERWGPYKDANMVDLALHVLDEVVHHAGEIGLLRDLYRRRDQLAGNTLTPV